jgi:hypothetical protein
MPITGQCFLESVGDVCYVIAVWDLGKSILANNGKIISKVELISSGFKIRQFSIDLGVYQALAKITEGVNVSEFLNPGDELMIFGDGYTTISLVKIIEKDFENNAYLLEDGKVICFGSLTGIYTGFTYPK